MIPPVLTKIERGLLHMWRAGLSPITNWRKIKCPYCYAAFRLKAGISGKRMVCSNSSCKRELPASVADYRDGLRPVTLSVIGAKQSGKSNYIAVLIEWIKRTNDDFQWHIWPMNDDTIDRYRDDFYKMVFHERRTVEVTRSGRTHAKTTLPLFFALSVKRKWRRRRLIILTFHDTAGEDFDAEEVMNKVTRYIADSQGLILLMDPLQLQTVRDRVDKSVHVPSINTHVEDIVTRTANFIKTVRGIPQSAKIEVPLAAVFTKVDVLLSLFPPDTALQHASKHVGYFDQVDFDDVNGEMRSVLHDWNARAVTSQVENHFPRHGYFGISALGCDPKPGVMNEIKEVKPIRILDPLIWHLSLHGILPTRK